MKWSTPWRVLVGDPAAILEAARTRWTLLVGFILVLSASLARKYDTVDLLAEPYELLHGVAAAMANAFGIHLLFWAMGSESPRPAFWRSYLSFLGVFMLAAPMGWVYGVPYEQFLPAAAAVSANMWSLAAVSVVRVVWMTRVLNVIWKVPEGKSSGGTFFALMIYCDAVAIVALLTAPIPTFDVMGGLQQPEEVRIVASTAFLAGFIAVVTVPIWLIGGAIALFSGRGRAWNVPSGATERATPRGALAVSAVAVIAWAATLPVMQIPVQNRTRVESLMAAGNFIDAARELCSRERNEFPPVWSPPPRVEAGEQAREGEMAGIVAAIASKADVPDWVVATYGGKSIRWCSRELGQYWMTVSGPPETGPFARGAEGWTRLSERDRVECWSRVRDEHRAGVGLCLRFVRDRVPSLAVEEAEELQAWIDAGEAWEAEEHGRVKDAARVESPR